MAQARRLRPAGAPGTMRRSRHERTPANWTRARGVSPIIATILLVAIVVVLAAVLYVVVLRVSGGASPKPPLASELLVGPAESLVGSSSTNAYCQSTHYCYSVRVASAPTGMALGDLSFRVSEPGGADWTVSKNYARLAVVNLAGLVLADTQISKNKPYDVPTFTTFSNGGSASTSIDTSMTIFVQFGNPAKSPVGQALALVVYSGNDYSGSVEVQLP